jgi:UDP-2,3-diacylglucosamine pyrophosphatase LpxH
MSLRDDITKIIVDSNIKQAVDKVDPNVVEVSFDDKVREINSIYNSHVTKQAIVKQFDNRPITIVPISDIHLGNKGCNIEKFEQALKLVDETPDCYTILMGDQAETATKTSVGLAMFEEDFHLEEQLKVLDHALKPLAEKGKILGMLTGNHEMRVSYMVKINPAELLCKSLNVPYLGYQGYILAKVGNQVYHIFASHGSSFGGSPAGKIMAARSLSKVADADLYLSGHTHAKLHDQDKLFRINETTGMVEPYIKHYVVCGSFLEYWGTYPEMKLLQPSFTGVAVIKLDSETKYIQVTT